MWGNFGQKLQTVIHNLLQNFRATTTAEFAILYYKEKMAGSAF